MLIILEGQKGAEFGFRHFGNVFVAEEGLISPEDVLTCGEDLGQLSIGLPVGICVAQALYSLVIGLRNFVVHKLCSLTHLTLNPLTLP